MEKVELSEKYFLACNRMHQEIDELYELIHDKSGHALTDETIVQTAIQSSVRSINIEMDLIKSCCFEENDK